ncbi:MAG: L-threonylcarbamoyladenylate synthase [Colwellia sp.]
MSSHSSIQQAFTVFNQGGVIAYPTEAVFGLGCDPDNTEAINKLLALKQRSVDKGLILLAGSYRQLLPYLNDDALTKEERDIILSRWPDAITQVLPAHLDISPLLCGIYSSIAVRVTNHPDVVALCEKTNKPIVSTSANLTGQPPATTWQEVEAQLGSKVDCVIKSETLGFSKPSTIINGLTGEVVRQ